MFRIGIGSAAGLTTEDFGLLSRPTHGFGSGAGVHLNGCLSYERCQGLCESGHVQESLPTRTANSPAAEEQGERAALAAPRAAAQPNEILPLRCE